MKNKLFSEESLREINFKASLIRKVEAIRKTDSPQYNRIIDKYKAEYKRIHLLPIDKLKDLISEISEKQKTIF